MAAAKKKPLFTIHRAELLPAIVAARQAVEARNAIPILGNVLLAPDGETLTVTATDQDVVIAAKAQCMDIDGAADAVTLSAAQLHDAVRRLPESAEIACSRDDARVHVQAGRTRLALPFLPAADFPGAAEQGFDTAFTLGKDVLATMLDAVSFAMSNEESRWYLNGVYAFAEDGQLGMVATDGHRLSLKHTAAEGAAGMAGIIMPRKTVTILAKMAADMETAIEAGANAFRVTCGAVTVTSAVINGTFPDHKRVIPSGYGNKADFAIDAMAAAIDRVMVVAGEKGHGIRLTGADDGTIGLYCASMSEGEADDTIDADVEGGFEVGCNGQYLRAILASFDTKSCHCEVGSAGDPILFTEADGLRVLMPMRV